MGILSFQHRAAIAGKILSLRFGLKKFLLDLDSSMYWNLEDTLSSRYKVEVGFISCCISSHFYLETFGGGRVSCMGVGLKYYSLPLI